MSTHRLIRSTHLALGLAFTLVWLMYAISSVQMSHPQWFPSTPERSSQDVPVRVGGEASAEVLAVTLSHLADVRGEVQNVQALGDTLVFRVVRPGTVHEITYVEGAPAATVVTQVGGFIAMLNRLHHYAGFWRGWLPLDLWGLLVGSASLGLILLGASGIYLWFRTHGERVVGGAILAVGVAGSLLLILLLRTAG